MKELEKLRFQGHRNWKTIISSLNHINQIRNKLAHDFTYDDALVDLTKWSAKINKKLIGEKHSKYTVRTKIAHAFSTLSENILTLTYEFEDIGEMGKS